MRLCPCLITESDHRSSVATFARKFTSVVVVFVLWVSVVCAASGCTTQTEISQTPDSEVDAVDPAVLTDIAAAIEFVERQVVNQDGRAVYEQSDGPDSLNISNMSPIQLLVVASHFYDERRALGIGAYDNGHGPDDDGFWPLGVKLHYLFCEEFYADHRMAVLNPPPYLASKEAALKWMHLHGYNLANMKREFIADLRE